MHNFGTVQRYEVSVVSDMCVNFAFINKLVLRPNRSGLAIIGPPIAYLVKEKTFPLDLFHA